MVPVGAYSLAIADASEYAAGDVVFVTVPITDAAFVDALRADKLCFSPKIVKNENTSVW